MAENNNDSEIKEEIKKSDEVNENKSFGTKLKDYVKNLLDFSKYDTKTLLFIILFIVLVVVSIFLLYLVLADETFLYRIVVEWFVNPIIIWGFIGIFLFIGIMAIQGLLVPIPSEIVLLASGMIWGVWIGGIMGVIGSMAAGMLCFYISRKGGRPLAEKFVGKNTLEMMDEFIQKHEMGAIIIARSMPILAFDPISYAAGLVDMDTKKYAIGTFIGAIPRALFYSFLGDILIDNIPGQPIVLADIPLEEIENLAQVFNLVLIIILGVLVAAFILSILLGKRYEKKKSAVAADLPK